MCSDYSSNISKHNYISIGQIKCIMCNHILVLQSLTERDRKDITFDNTLSVLQKDIKVLYKQLPHFLIL